MRRLASITWLLACLTGCGGETVRFFEADGYPQRLSEWSVITRQGDALVLGTDVVPYDLNTPLFTDYALKLRTVWLPPGTSAAYTTEGALDFPVGTIISKTFHYEKSAQWEPASYAVSPSDRESLLDGEGALDLDDYVLVETRLLVRYDDGWRALPYVWNAAQTDATLEIAGD